MAFTAAKKREYYGIKRLGVDVLPEFYKATSARDKLAEGVRFKSEVLSYSALADLFTGVDRAEEEIVETEYKKKKEKDRKKIRPFISEILGVSAPKYVTVDDIVAAFDNWLGLRDKARKELFWLAKVVLKKDLEPDVHQIICDQFVKKNFDGAFPDGYALSDIHDAIDRQERFDEFGKPTKEMMLLDSRHFFKSTIDGIDIIQWMLNVPDIRIFIMTGVYKLGVGFLREIKGYLYLPDRGEPTDLHLLFPEYILRGLDGTSKEPLFLKIRKYDQPNATVWFNSIDSSLSGGHCDIRKADDVVDDSNSNTEDTRAEIKLKWDGTFHIPGPWGFTDYIGTRYFPDDLYGSRIKSYRENPEENSLKYFCRACWTVKPEFTEVPLKGLTEDMVVLTFPKLFKFKRLRKSLLDNEISFRCQMLNEPVGLDKDDGFRVQFNEDVLHAHVIPSSAAPKEGDVYICWDWALTANRKSDMSVGVAGRRHLKDGIWSFYILEIIFGRWTSSELALQIVSLDKKWHPTKTLIEASGGSELLKLEIWRARIFEVAMDIFWKPPAIQENAKRNRIKGTETLLADNRLWFVSGAWLDETFRQLLRYTGEPKNRGRKDDIPDALSYMTFFLPNSPVSSKDADEMLALTKAQKKQSLRKRNYEMYFGGTMQPAPAPVDPGQPQRLPGDIFGGNGLRALRVPR